MFQLRWSTLSVLVAVALCWLQSTCSAQQADEALISEGSKIFQQITAKCQAKAVPVQAALTTAAQCAEPLLRQSNLIPQSLYPGKYKSLMDSCFGRLNPSANMCDRVQLDQIKKCGMQKGFSALPQLKQLYQTNKNEVLDLVRKLIASCVPRIQNL